MATIQQKTDLPGDTLPYEYKRKGIKGGVHWVVIQILNLLPKKAAQFLFTLASEKGEETRTVSDTVATFQALEIMYTFPQKRKEGTATSSGFIWWTVLDNARSVWNRLLLVKQELREAVLTVAAQKGSVHFLSIGSGSARPALGAIASLEQEVPIESMLLDQNPQATEFSRKLAQQFNLNHTQWVTGDFFRLEQHCRSFHPNVIELVGLLDYLNNTLAIFFLKKVFRVLEPGGFLITGNIAPNLERPYVEKGVKWPSMVYRTEEDLKGLLLEAGFAENHIRIQREPLGIHMVATVRKPQESMVS
ncbi:MAG: class I SAM-dependent methyltransferase family protein [bacterium]|nr:class I SAM-dependent methyltransferase family protein [bacterium]